ncbi:four-helix bundle copper-binding protein [Halovivax sp.]|uniref:four-helix bundle copper-binding protein n=1 Tax=Halovivax sp. TaxID=1935978 RepID=UPI0025C551B9|nr:four-helix bundle copper-binding protein [Halovivax sp.]
MALKSIDHVNEDDRMAECIDNCFEAAQVCEWCADECVGMGDEEMARCIRLCRDVADVATLHARFMARNSGYHADLAATCADLCEECANVCAKFDHDHCQACVDVLRECSNSCRDMASA